MTLQSVDVYALDDTLLHNPIAGLMVRVFDSTGVTFITQDVTNTLGHVGFTLDDGALYSLRFFKFGVQVTQPQFIPVITPTPTLLNSFNIYGTVFQHPVAIDARLCRASGYFRDITGAKQPAVDMFFIGQFDPILLEGACVLSERCTARTDQEGYACIDLIRGARYLVTLQGFEDSQRQIEVPDRSSVNLPDLLFPVVDSVALSPTGPYSLAVGAQLAVTPTVLSSNQVPIDGIAAGDMIWSSSDPSILSVFPISGTQLMLQGISPGTASIQGTRSGQSVIRVPNTPIVGLPQTVTVS